MAILVTGNTFSNGDQVTAAKLNASVNSATFHAGAVDGSTTQLSSGSIIVKDGGIIPAKLSTGGPSWVSGGLNSLGDLSLTNANPEILGGDTDGVMYVAPSTTKDLGGNILLYGDTHASKAKDIEIRATTGVEAHYDDSASKWDFQANAISTSGAITAAGTSVFTNLNISGAVDVGGTLETDALSIASTAVTSTAAELNYNDTGAAVGTVVASKTVTVNSDKDVSNFRNIVLTGILFSNSLDISGDADINGTTNLDDVDIDGNVQIDGTVTVGVNDTGHDVKFFGATSGAYMHWDESTDDLILGGAAKLGIGTTSPDESLDVVGAGRFSTGVTFGTDTAAANKLDDYEEGTWTPVLKIGGATTGISYGAAVGSYTKIGNLVNASLYVLLSSKGSATGSVTIDGLPFASANTTNGFASAHIGSILACTWANYPAGYLSKNTSAITFNQYTEAGGSSGISNSNLTDTSSFIMSITYRV